MKLKSFGCSFIFGSDLSDINKNLLYKNPVGHFSRQTWPSHMANYLGYEYECHARPGSGNLQIAERVLNQLANNESAFYVIGWTWIDRFDYYSTDDFWQPWETIRPMESSKISTLYYKKLHSEYQDKLKSLMYMRLVINGLKEKGFPFIITYIDDLTFDQRWNVMPGVLELQKYIQPHMTTFEGQTFLEWAKKKGFPISENLHPLEPAHQAAFELIKGYNLI